MLLRTTIRLIAQRRSIRSASSHRAESNAVATGMKAPTISSSTRKRIESQEEARARVINRARAYEALCEAEAEEQVPEEPPTPPSKDYSPSQLHPTSMQPGWTAHGPAPLRVVHENTKVVISDTRTSDAFWKPQKPVYAQGAPGKEAANGGSKEITTQISQYVPYRPPPPVPPKDKPQQLKPKPGAGGGVKRRPVPLNLHGVVPQNGSNGEASRSIASSAQPKTTNPSPRSGVQPWDISKPYEVKRTPNSHANTPPSVGKRVYKAYTPSATPSPSLSTFPSQVRRMLTPPTSPSAASRTPVSPSYAPVSPSYTTTPITPSPFPASPRSSSSNISRSRSPARGSWTADRPRQQPQRSSFVDRARDRMRASWHLNLQKAGVRPLSSFEVRDVRKGYVKDVATEWMGSSMALGDCVGVEMEGRGRGGGECWAGGFDGLEERARRHLVRESRREGKEEQQMQRGRSFKERARGLSFDAHATGLSRKDSLFLGTVNRPTSETFFASDWSQQQVINQAKEMVAELPGSSSFHRGPFGKKDGGEVAPKQRKAASSSRGVTTSANDRGLLPSQTRGRSRIPVPVRPKLSRRHALSGKGSRRLK
ncbi:uncharacterized protein F4807DRAFT_448331 [Annulohypoxylon truncatum]|uniref:uncharacterized protein n=1 Tax=Annulohypoxylon truncatum TaxID=327061 RepID=UPI0020079F7E|nr:uncharacterized protein F4807DRAFT_448331 [Annulohypoxylon truncatum]KAI1204250.1 hypothetical protein F4807DRAFT_448331 [Annulohypoxylon truncatum]